MTFLSLVMSPHVAAAEIDCTKYHLTPQLDRGCKEANEKIKQGNCDGLTDLPSNKAITFKDECEAEVSRDQAATGEVSGPIDCAPYHLQPELDRGCKEANEKIKQGNCDGLTDSPVNRAITFRNQCIQQLGDVTCDNLQGDEKTTCENNKKTASFCENQRYVDSQAELECYINEDCSQRQGAQAIQDCEDAVVNKISEIGCDVFQDEAKKKKCVDLETSSEKDMECKGGDRSEGFTGVLHAVFDPGALALKAVTFLVCSVIGTLADVAGTLENGVNSLLNSNVDTLFGDSASGQGMHRAWAALRAIAVGLIIIALLMLVLGEALGLTTLNAYTIRKALPRLLIAAIVISLSWDLLEFADRLSQDVGLGLRSLVLAPFKSMERADFLSGGSSAISILIGTGASLAFGWVGLLLASLGAFVSIGAAFIVLLIRNILVMALVMLAPVAIAMYVLPGTQQAWNLWRKSFLSVLIVFPIFALFIAVGRVFALIALNSDGNQTINQLIAIISYFLPYFLLGTAFQMAGGVMGAVGGFIGKGATAIRGKIAERRNELLKNRVGEAKRGTLMKGNGKFSNLVNQTTREVGLGTTGLGSMVAGKGLGKRAGHRNLLTSMARHELMKSHEWETHTDNEEAMRALTYVGSGGGGLGQAQKELAERYRHEGLSQQQAEAQAQTAVTAATMLGRRFGQNGVTAQAAAMSLVKSGTGYENIKDQTKTFARVAGNDDRARELAIEAYAINKGGGRADLAPGGGELAGAIQAEMHGRGNEVNYGALTEAGFSKANKVTLATQRQQSYQNFAEHWGGELEQTRGQSGGLERQRKVEVAAQAMEAATMSPYATAENKAAYRQHIESREPLRGAIRRRTGLTKPIIQNPRANDLLR